MGRDGPGALPTVVVIGTMKCGTTALHRMLDSHPEIAMAESKELNFFIGPEVPPDPDPGTWWRTGQWHRGVRWYASQFDARFPVRGESSPGYTSPDHGEVAPRMADVLPDARIVFAVRDPVRRALSQYHHHRRDGAERRSPEEALLDPDAHYLSRGRYHERLQPFLQRFHREQILVVVQERLRSAPARELRAVHAHVGADPERDSRPESPQAPSHPGKPSPRRADVEGRLRDAARERLADDLARLRELIQDDIPEWSV
ncbi:MAG TPA: sulfotransferase [Nocardioidaceae bacterium]|jgi:hypothetical protein|nr:sulfotransferase [Nocardioidaceae bacterium]